MADRTGRISAVVTAEQDAEIDRLADATGTNRSQIIRWALEHGLARVRMLYVREPDAPETESA